VHLVDTERELAEVAASLADARTLYLDTEFDSTRDGKTLCLLQISKGERVHLIDTLRLGSLDALRPLLADGGREWVLHAGSQDVDLLAIRFDLPEPPRVFDTQVAWALTSVEHSVALAYLKFQLLGIRSGKSHQADDWKRRPLPSAQLAYAAADIEELPRLHQALHARLAARRRERLIFDVSREVTWPVREEPEPLAVDDFRNAWQLDVHCQAALRHLIGWYNGLGSRERAHAPDSKTLLSIASRRPESLADLGRIKGVGRRFAAEHGEHLLAGMRRAAADADTQSFVPIDPPPYATAEEVRLEGWLALARAEIAASLEVAPELAFPSRLMRRLAAHIAESGDRARGAEVFQGWRRELIAPAFAAFAAR